MRTATGLVEVITLSDLSSFLPPPFLSLVLTFLFLPFGHSAAYPALPQAWNVLSLYVLCWARSRPSSLLSGICLVPQPFMSKPLLHVNVLFCF
ncbi:hypothetical protein EDD16DRAFT_1570708 [Pisolithus croceorrhizus]|nr:hypothetical protein EDD16DRAFT_1570708 [Pisolithus croceorrhizus]